MESEGNSDAMKLFDLLDRLSRIEAQITALREKHPEWSIPTKGES